MSLNNNHHQNNTGNRYYAQSSYNQASMNLYQPTASLSGTNNQGQTGGYSLTNLNQPSGYQSHYALNQQVNMPQLNHHSGNNILPGPQGINSNPNILITPQHSRAYRPNVPPLPGQVQNSSNTIGSVLKSQPTNIQKRKNDVEIDSAIDNLPSSQKKIKTENIQLIDTIMNIESEARVPTSYKIYELSQFEISKEIDEKIQNTKKTLEDIPRVKPNYISLQSCEAAKLQVDLFPQKFFHPEFKNELRKDIFEDPNCFNENPQSKSQKRVFCLVEDIQRLMNVLKLDKDLEAKQFGKNKSTSLKESKKKNEENKKTIKRGPGRRKKITDDSEQVSDKSFIEEDEDDEDSHSRGESDNQSHSQSTSAIQKKKSLRQKTKKKRGPNKKILNDKDDSSEDQNSESEEDDDEYDSPQNDQNEQESSQQPIKKKRILKRKKSLVSDDSSGKNYEDMLDEGIDNEKNKNQDDSGEKVKNKRGRKLLQKNKLGKGKNKNAIESDDEEEQNLSLNKKDKTLDDLIDNDNPKVGRKLVKNKLQIDDDEDKSDTVTQQPQKQEQTVSQIQMPPVVKIENKTKMEAEEDELDQKQDQQIKEEALNQESDIKVEEKIEHTDIQQEVKSEIDIKIENKLIKVKDREQNFHNRLQELEKRQKYIYDQQQKLLQLSLQYNVSILEQKHAASNLEIVNKHVSIS